MPEDILARTILITANMLPLQLHVYSGFLPGASHSSVILWHVTDNHASGLVLLSNHATTFRLSFLDGMSRLLTIFPAHVTLMRAACKGRCYKRPEKLADKESGRAEVQMTNGTDGSDGHPGQSALTHSHEGSRLGPLRAASCFGGCAACLHMYHSHRHAHAHTVAQAHLPGPIQAYPVGVIPEHSPLEAHHHALQYADPDFSNHQHSLHVATSSIHPDDYVTNSQRGRLQVPNGHSLGHGGLYMEPRAKVGRDGLEQVIPELNSPPGGSGVIPTRPLAQPLSPLRAEGPANGINRAQTWSSSPWVEPPPLGNCLRTPFASAAIQQRASRLPASLMPADASMYGLAEGSPTGQEHTSLVRSSPQYACHLQCTVMTENQARIFRFTDVLCVHIDLWTTKR